MNRKVNSTVISYYGIIIIFAMLLVHSAVTMFVGGGDNTGIQQIDIILRTTMGSLFGYIISKVSMKNPTKKNQTTTSINIPPQSIEVKKTEGIGFRMELEGDNQPVTEQTKTTISIKSPLSTIKKEKANERVKYSQSIILVSICSFCLLVMMFVRNFSFMVSPTGTAEVTLSQYRDFISSSVGALIALSRREV